MSTILAFLMTLAELSMFAAGYYLGHEALLNFSVIQGSPLYFVKSIISNEYHFTQHHVFPLAMAFHSIKYVALARSQFLEDYPSLNYLAIILEIVYLVLCFNYL